MSHDNYNYLTNHLSDLEERIALYEHLASSEDDIKLGRVQKANDVYDELRNEIEHTEL